MVLRQIWQSGKQDVFDVELVRMDSHLVAGYPLIFVSICTFSVEVVKRGAPLRSQGVDLLADLPRTSFVDFSSKRTARRQLAAFFQRMKSVAENQFSGSLAIEVDTTLQIYSTLQFLGDEDANDARSLKKHVGLLQTRLTQARGTCLTWLHDVCVALDKVEARMLEELISRDESLELKEEQIASLRAEVAALQVPHKRPHRHNRFCSLASYLCLCIQDIFSVKTLCSRTAWLGTGRECKGTVVGQN